MRFWSIIIIWNYCTSIPMNQHVRLRNAGVGLCMSSCRESQRSKGVLLQTVANFELLMQTSKWRTEDKGGQYCQILVPFTIELIRCTISQDFDYSLTVGWLFQVLQLVVQSADMFEETKKAMLIEYTLHEGQFVSSSASSIDSQPQNLKSLDIWLLNSACLAPDVCLYFIADTLFDTSTWNRQQTDLESSHE